MPRKRLDDIKSFLRDFCYNRALSGQPLDDVPPSPLDPKVPYLYRLEYPVLEPPEDPEKSKRNIVARLKSFLYPYPQGNKSNKTFYEFLKSLGLLEILINPPLLFRIRMVWHFSGALPGRIRS